MILTMEVMIKIRMEWGSNELESLITVNETSNEMRNDYKMKLITQIKLNMKTKME